MTNNQCTGQPSYQGDQDNDPNNNADCHASIRANEVHVAEVQVFGADRRPWTAPGHDRVAESYHTIEEGRPSRPSFVSEGPAMLARP